MTCPRLTRVRPSVSDRGHRDERRLFETSARLQKARAELAVGEEQLETLDVIAEDLRVRSLVSETAHAAREYQQAQRHLDALAASLEATRARVRELEQLQDQLIDRLVGGLTP